VVVDDVQHFDGGSVGELVVGDVQLPALVRGVGDEALPAGFGAFVRLWGDESTCGQDPPDRRDRRGVAVALLQVRGDGGGARFVSVAVEVFAQRDDLVLDRLRVRPGLERGRRERGARPGSPSLRNRWTRVMTQRRETP